MSEAPKPLVLCVDDDVKVLKALRWALEQEGFRAAAARGPREAFAFLADSRPDVILLDVQMPEMDGFEVCSRLQENEDLFRIPVIFVTGLREDRDRARAFSAGGVDYLVKPFVHADLVAKVNLHLETRSRWARGRAPSTSPEREKDFAKLKDYLADRWRLAGAGRETWRQAPPAAIYPTANSLGRDEAETAAAMARFLGWGFCAEPDPRSVQLGVLPTAFSLRNMVVAVEQDGQEALLFANPFQGRATDGVESFIADGGERRRLISPPSGLCALFR